MDVVREAGERGDDGDDLKMKGYFLQQCINFKEDGETRTIAFRAEDVLASSLILARSP